MENILIRQTAKQHGVKLWQIAEKLNIQEQYFSRKLRHELPADEQERIMQIIADIAKEEQGTKRMKVKKEILRKLAKAEAGANGILENNEEEFDCFWESFSTMFPEEIELVDLPYVHVAVAMAMQEEEG